MAQPIFNQNLSTSALTAFKELLGGIALFHGLFLGLMAAEVLLIALFFSFLMQSALVAISIALLTLTIFCYFVLKLWIYTKKRQDFTLLADSFQESIQRGLQGDESSHAHYVALTKALLSLSEALKKEAAPHFKFLNYFLSKVYVFIMQKDLLFVQELILSRTIQLWLTFIRKEPTHLEAHAALASTYITFSALYTKGSRFTSLVQKAAEEFKILSDYAPSDIWAHTQLAYTYHDLGMRQEEIKEYEAILALKPQDSDTLFKLGVLYFQEGSTAKALSLYEELKKLRPEQSQELIAFYA